MINKLIRYALHNRYINRPLSEEEWDGYLDPKTKGPEKPRPAMANVALNSSYLELVDFFHETKGRYFLGGIIFLVLFPIIYPFFLHTTIIKWHIYVETQKVVQVIFLNLLLIASTIGAVWLGWHFLRMDAFGCTYYPIRLCRKNRMVYAFRYDGTILSASWDEIFFTRVHTKNIGEWRLIGFILDEGREIIQEPIFFLNPGGDEDDALKMWEYIRSYMEDGPKNVHRITNYCVPLGDRREPPWYGFAVLIMTLNGYPLLQLLVLPIVLVTAIMRALASLTCKIPVWPKEIQEACVIAPNDPYKLDWHDNPPFFKMKPPTE